jgi:hypothetical protein
MHIYDFMIFIYIIDSFFFSRFSVVFIQSLNIQYRIYTVLFMVRIMLYFFVYLVVVAVEVYVLRFNINLHKIEIIIQF